MPPSWIRKSFLHIVTVTLERYTFFVLVFSALCSLCPAFCLPWHEMVYSLDFLPKWAKDSLPLLPHSRQGSSPVSSVNSDPGQLGPEPCFHVRNHVIRWACLLTTAHACKLGTKWRTNGKAQEFWLVMVALVKVLSRSSPSFPPVWQIILYGACVGEEM